MFYICNLGEPGRAMCVGLAEITPAALPRCPRVGSQRRILPQPRSAAVPLVRQQRSRSRRPRDRLTRDSSRTDSALHAIAATTQRAARGCSQTRTQRHARPASPCARPPLPASIPQAAGAAWAGKGAGNSGRVLELWKLENFGLSVLAGSDSQEKQNKTKPNLT